MRNLILVLTVFGLIGCEMKVEAPKETKGNASTTSDVAPGGVLSTTATSSAPTPSPSPSANPNTPNETTVTCFYRDNPNATEFSYKIVTHSSGDQIIDCSMLASSGSGLYPGNSNYHAGDAALTTSKCTTTNNWHFEKNGSVYKYYYQSVTDPYPVMPRNYQGSECVNS